MILHNLRLAVIGDLHSGEDRASLPGSAVADLLEGLVQHLNEKIEPDAVIDLGDRLNCSDREADLRNLVKIDSVLSHLQCPVYYICGNHDLENLDSSVYEKVLKRKLENRSLTIKGFRLLLIDSQDPVIDGVGGSVSADSLSWIDTEIGESSEPVIVFTHQALDDQDLEENIHFASMKELAYVENRLEITKLFKKHGNIVAAVNGHLHWHSVSLIDNTVYISVPSFTETWNKYEKIPGAYSVIDFDSGRMTVGNYTMQPSVLTSRVAYSFCGRYSKDF